MHAAAQGAELDTHISTDNTLGAYVKHMRTDKSSLNPLDANDLPPEVGPGVLHAVRGHCQLEPDGTLLLKF